MYSSSNCNIVVTSEGIGGVMCGDHDIVRRRLVMGWVTVVVKSVMRSSVPALLKL